MILELVGLHKRKRFGFRLLNSEIGNDQTELMMNDLETSKFSSP